MHAQLKRRGAYCARHVRYGARPLIERASDEADYRLSFEQGIFSNSFRRHRAHDYALVTS